MPDGYLVQLGDGKLDPGDGIVGPLITFVTDQELGAGNWIWSGTWNGITFTDEPEPGAYFLATNGNIYFVPAFGPVDTLTSASTTVTPAIIIGTSGADAALIGDGDDETIDGREGADTIDGNAGEDTILGGAGNDSIEGGAGADSINAGDDDDIARGGSEADELYGGSGNDDLFGDDGADLLIGGSGNDDLFGGTGDDTLYGDQNTSVAAETLQWSLQGADNDDLSGGFTQTTGTMDVTVSITDDGALTSAQLDTATTQYTETGEPFATNSALELAGNGGASTATVRVDFSGIDDTDTLDAAENVSFRINDIDTGTWIDTLSIAAFDTDGNPVTITITPESASNTTSGNNVTAGVANGTAASQTGSILVEIAGPVDFFEISYGNDSTGAQRAWLSDISFTPAVAPDGDDTFDGGLGADDMFGGGGNDTFALADGDEAFGEDGDDVFVLNDLGEAAGAILIDGGEGAESAGDTLRLNGEASLSDVVFDAGNS
ncbi:MAG: calcium-binding protein, partial [Pseudomonadota bacterium]